MKKMFFLIVILVIITTAAVPLFAGISLDLGVSALGNAVYPASRPLGANVALGMTLFDNKALVQIVGGIFSPPLADDYSDPAASLSAGVLFSPAQFLYIGFRTGMISPPDEIDDWANYGAVVFRVQRQEKGLNFFAETELALLGYLNRFTAGINLTL